MTVPLFAAASSHYGSSRRPAPSCATTDWPGVVIANGLMRRLPVTPWRFCAADYATAVAADLGAVLSGRPVTASWDPALTTRMQASARKVEEEHVLADLLTDLDGA